MAEPFGARSWRRPQGGRPWVLGHRGARQSAPENTLAAFELARQQGADGVELDVRLDGTGRVVVFHDPTLGRATEQRDLRQLEDLTADELARVRVGGEPVPLLEDVLAWSHETNQRLNIELKRDVRHKAALVLEVGRRIARVADAPERVVLSSFDPAFVRGLSLLLPEVAVAWLVHAKQRWLRRAPGARLTGASGVHPEHVLLDRASIASYRGGSRFVGTWTVNDPARAALLAALGVDTLISDAPGDVLAALGPSSR